MRASPAEAQSPGGFLQPWLHRHLLRTAREPLVAERMLSRCTSCRPFKGVTHAREQHRYHLIQNSPAHPFLQ